ncbi:Acyl-CoA dehydrogenase [Albimonas donghaensis]|uniref:Acyl-CoA dehydrogenase n=1 Tax=Albimonas donghaensis TaxID=356660 RepID=A0A1H2VHX2_9RHOB|nr:acyl-CoA dehydrogenase family protein [Albimonas donghaensis]SDW67911.1 Acyl-CoA dehydrogenase [Albimonas donghaensis]
MNAFLDEEQTLLQNQVRRWLDENVSPLIDRHEAAKTFPFEILSDLAQFGYLGGRIPEADGGYDLPYVTWGMLMERAGYCWGSLRTILNITNGTIQKLSTHGTEEQKARWLKPILANQLKVCTGLSEPNIGSNVRGIETRAVWKGDHYVLSGRKLWITNGVNADIAQIVARVSGSPDCEDGKLSTFIVERGMAGYSARPVEKMVLRCTGTAELELDDVVVPAENRLGPEGRALAGTLAGLNTARVNIAMGAVGAAQAALDLSIDYAKTRKQFGKPIGAFQLVQKHIVDMTVRVKAARALSYQAAAALDRGLEAREDCSIAKLYATGAAFEVADMALQVHGGLGYAVGYPIERIFRDTRGGMIPEGTSEIQTLIAGREILGIDAIA